MSETFRTSSGRIGSKVNPHFTWDALNPRNWHLTTQLHEPSCFNASDSDSGPRVGYEEKGRFIGVNWEEPNAPSTTLRTFENLETFELLGVLVTRTHQSSGGSPLGAIFTSRGSNRARASTRSLWAAITSSMSL
jgi:hypothetical protein